MPKLICNGKYFVGGLKDDAIGLSVFFSNLPETMKVEGIILHRKSSFHATLFPVGKVVEKYNIYIPDFLDKIVADFCQFVEANPIDLLRYHDEFKFAAENERRTVIVMCDVSNLNKFYDLINKKYNLQLEYPPTHVTLYTLQPDAGIYLTDAEEIKKLAKPIENPGVVL